MVVFAFVNVSYLWCTVWELAGWTWGMGGIDFEIIHYGLKTTCHHQVNMVLYVGVLLSLHPSLDLCIVCCVSDSVSF